VHKLQVEGTGDWAIGHQIAGKVLLRGVRLVCTRAGIQSRRARGFFLGQGTAGGEYRVSGMQWLSSSRCIGLV
jgi:hypothetical protein